MFVFTLNQAYLSELHLTAQREWVQPLLLRATQETCWLIECRHTAWPLTGGMEGGFLSFFCSEQFPWVGMHSRTRATAKGSSITCVTLLLFKSQKRAP